MTQNYEKATRIYREAVTNADKITGKNMNEMLSKIKNNLGLALKEQGSYEEAISSFSSSLVAHMLVSDSDSDTANTINNLASCHFDLGNKGGVFSNVKVKI